MHDNGTEEIQDFCADCFPAVDEVQAYWEGEEIQYIIYNPVHADYAANHYQCDSEECCAVLGFEDINAGLFTTIMPFNGKLNYAAG